MGAAITLLVEVEVAVVVVVTVLISSLKLRKYVLSRSSALVKYYCTHQQWDGSGRSLAYNHNRG
jgi:hypothetical protein